MRERIAVFIDKGFDERELIYPFYRLLEAGYAVDLVADSPGTYLGKQGYAATATSDFDTAAHTRYRALYVPGGHAPETLKENPRCLQAVRTLAAGGSLLCAVCHGPLLFACAGALQGRHVTGYRTILSELRSAGAVVTGNPVERDREVITAKNPAALPAMMRVFLQALHAEG